MGKLRQGGKGIEGGCGEDSGVYLELVEGAEAGVFMEGAYVQQVRADGDADTGR